MATSARPQKTPYVCEWLQARGQIWSKKDAAPNHQVTHIFMDGRGVAKLSTLPDYENMFKQLARDIRSPDIQGRVTLCECMPPIKGTWLASSPPPLDLLRRSMAFFDERVEDILEESAARLNRPLDRGRVQSILTALRGTKRESPSPPSSSSSSSSRHADDDVIEVSRSSSSAASSYTHPSLAKSPIRAGEYDWNCMCFFIEADYGKVASGAPDYTELIADAQCIATTMVLFGFPLPATRVIMQIVDEGDKLGVHYHFPLSKMWPEECFELARAILVQFIRHRPLRGDLPWSKIIDLGPYQSQLRYMGVQKSEDCLCKSTNKKSSSSSSSTTPSSETATTTTTRKRSRTSSTSGGGGGGLPGCQQCFGRGRVYGGRRYFPTLVLDFSQTTPDLVRSSLDESFAVFPVGQRINLSSSSSSSSASSSTVSTVSEAEIDRMVLLLTSCSPRMHQPGVPHSRFKRPEGWDKCTFPSTWVAFFQSVVDAALLEGVAHWNTELIYSPWSSPAGEADPNSSLYMVTVQNDADIRKEVERRQRRVQNLHHMLAHASDSENLSDVAIRMMKEYEDPKRHVIERNSPQDKGKCQAIETWLRHGSCQEYARITVVRVIHMHGDTTVIVTGPGERYCRMRGGHHKKNLIFFKILQRRAEVVQRCLDDDCNHNPQSSSSSSKSSKRTVTWASVSMGSLLDSTALMLMFCPAKLLQSLKDGGGVATAAAAAAASVAMSKDVKDAKGLTRVQAKEMIHTQPQLQLPDMTKTQLRAFTKRQSEELRIGEHRYAQRMHRPLDDDEIQAQLELKQKALADEAELLQLVPIHFIMLPSPSSSPPRPRWRTWRRCLLNAVPPGGVLASTTVVDTVPPPTKRAKLRNPANTEWCGASHDGNLHNQSTVQNIALLDEKIRRLADKQDQWKAEQVDHDLNGDHYREELARTVDTVIEETARSDRHVSPRQQNSTMRP